MLNMKKSHRRIYYVHFGFLGKTTNVEIFKALKNCFFEHRFDLKKCTG